MISWQLESHEANQNMQIFIHNAAGQMAIQSRVSGQQGQLNLKELPDGMYMLQLRDDSGSLMATQKIVKQ